MTKNDLKKQIQKYQKELKILKHNYDNYEKIFLYSENDIVYCKLKNTLVPGIIIDSYFGNKRL